MALNVLIFVLSLQWQALPSGGGQRGGTTFLSCPSGPKCLAPLFGALHPSMLHKTPVRVVYYGDSLINGGVFTASLRRLLQERFGGSGTGWFPPAVHPMNITTPGIELVSSGWKVFSIVGPHSPGYRYGLGGILASIHGEGGVTSCRLRRPVRNAVLTIGFIRRKYGGRFHVNLPGRRELTVSTRGRGWEPALYRLRISGLLRGFRISSSSGGFVTLTGFSIEAGMPGIQVDAAGFIGARASHLSSRALEEWGRALALWRPSLVVFHVGSNDTLHDIDKARLDEFVRTIRSLPCLHRSCACLVVGVAERRERNGEGGTRISALTLGQQRFYRSAARAGGCAFFDTFRAMGGENSAISWYRKYPKRLYGDLIHFTPLGGLDIAKRLTLELFAQLMAFRRFESRRIFSPKRFFLQRRGFLHASLTPFGH